LIASAKVTNKSPYNNGVLRKAEADFVGSYKDSILGMHTKPLSFLVFSG
jgi:hypothetical protein